MSDRHSVGHHGDDSGDREPQIAHARQTRHPLGVNGDPVERHLLRIQLDVAVGPMSALLDS